MTAAWLPLAGTNIARQDARGETRRSRVAKMIAALRLRFKKMKKSENVD